MYVVNFKVKYLVKFYLFKIILRLYQNHTPTLPKSHSDFTKTTGWFSLTGWFSQNHTPIFPKSHSDFSKITMGLYQNCRLIFTKSLADFRKKEGWFWSPRLLFYRTPFQNRTLPHCESCLSEGFSSCVTSLSGSPHCFCPCLLKKNLVLFSSCLAFHHLAVLR